MFLEVCNLTKTYGDRRIVHDLSFSLRENPDLAAVYRSEMKIGSYRQPMELMPTMPELSQYLPLSGPPTPSRRTVIRSVDLPAHQA